MMNREEVIERLQYFENKDSNLEIFGASTHQYLLHPPLDKVIINDYEESHSIKLPKEFVRCYTQVGGGGAGPYYGLHEKLNDITLIPTPLLASECLNIDIDFNQISYYK